MTVIDLQVSASADDADETVVGGVSLTGAPLLNIDNIAEWNIYVFRGVTIPAGATIDVAYLELYFPTASLDEPFVRFHGEDAATPATPEATTNNISARTLTTAYTDWSSTGLGSSAAWYTTPSMVGIVQELVDSYAPYSSGVMAFIVHQPSTDATRDYQVQSYDGDTSLAAKLHIEYTAAAGGVSITPAAVYAVSATVNPTTILGSVSITPAQVGSVSAVVAPSVIQSSLTIADKIAAAIGAVVNPTTVLGSLSITPNTAGSVSSTVAPNVIQGAISIANKLAEAIGAVVNPTVSAGGGALITPDPASGISSTVSPGVVLGSLTILNKIASAIGLTVNPTVVHGSMAVTPDPAGSVSTTVAPTVSVTDPGTPATRKRFLDFPWWIR